MRQLVLSSSGAWPPWAEHLADPHVLAQDAIPADLDSFDSVWIDAPGLQPLQVARKVAAADDAVQTLVVAPPEDMGIHERALLFTPGLGEVWLVGPDEVEPETLNRAREVTTKRRSYRTSRSQMSRKLQDFERDRPRRAVVSDAYLAALLHVLPDPVISVDEAGRIVSWSAAAEHCLGVTYERALGRSVVEVLAPTDPEPLRAVLERGRKGSARLELSVQGAKRPLIMELVVTPVAAGGVEVRTLVLRDVTRERESLARLEREVELRSRSYAAMSHEIRTPINSIMGYNELLRMGVEDEKRDEYLDRSRKAAAHLLELVNDVLDLSKLESGVLEVQPQPVSVAEVIQDLISTLEPLARERETPLEVHCDPESATISTDAKRLKQILINLVSNALKFGEGRPVRVVCHRSESGITFAVEDQGRGIDPSEIERVFEEFVQVGDSGEGTGLGLPISKKLAEVLGGELTAESTLGEGSTFRLALPLEIEARSSSPSAKPTEVQLRTRG